MDVLMHDDLTEPLVELIRRASTDLPADVEAALRAARDREEGAGAARSALETILENVAFSRARSSPVCQDTGTPIFHVHHPQAVSARQLRATIEAAVAEATRRAYLRPNAVDSVSGRNSGNNLGVAFPTFHFEEWEQEALRVELLLKGGGSENVSIQYALPYTPLEAGRDLEGVRRVVLDAVYRAQGQGCAPGVLGIALGGDRSTGYVGAKEQLLRPLTPPTPPLEGGEPSPSPPLEGGEPSPSPPLEGGERGGEEVVPELAALEERLLRECNELGIGPMGFGGKTTILGVKIGAFHRLPACYFVTIAYMCWACRRAKLEVRDGGVSFG